MHGDTVRVPAVTYPGGKSGAGVYQRIINQIPPHRVYIEAFAGGAAILRKKKPAAISIAVDADGGVIDQLATSDPPIGSCTFVHGDAISLLEEYAWRGDEFVYCDPPYLHDTRKGGRIYNHEMSDDDHRRLLSVIQTIPAAVMISGYPSKMYYGELSSWVTIGYQAMTRGGTMADEVLWMNYPPPALLHDDQFLGDNFRERERIKRKRTRWVNRFATLPQHEQGAIYRELSEVIRAAAIVRNDTARATPETPMRAGSHRHA